MIDAEWLLAMSDFSRVVSALNYLLCFETIGSLTQRTSCSFKKKSCATYPRRFYWGRMEEENVEGKWLSSRRWSWWQFEQLCFAFVVLLGPLNMHCT